MTFASFLTPEGIVVAGTVITTLITLLRTAIPPVATISGALLAFVLSAVLYVLVALTVGVPTPDAALTIFASWLTCAVAAVGVHSTAVHAQESITGTPPA